MGEYGVRKKDGLRIKIGTCESNYYVRYEDKGKVEPDHGSGFGYFWRLPLPDEDGIEPGDYQSHVATVRLWKKEQMLGTDGKVLREWTVDFSDHETMENPGIVQLKHECGLMINAPCYHGEMLPGMGDSKCKAFWNGKSWFYELRFLRETSKGIFPVVHCRVCGHMWRYDWKDILPYLHGELKERLSKYATNEE